LATLREGPANGDHLQRSTDLPDPSSWFLQSFGIRLKYGGLSNYLLHIVIIVDMHEYVSVFVEAINPSKLVDYTSLVLSFRESHHPYLEHVDLTIISTCLFRTFKR